MVKAHVIMFSSILTFLFLLSVIKAEDSVTLTTPVETSYGPVQGAVHTYDGTTVHVFKGIPFAAPPVGELRFASPVAPEPWTEPLRCVEYRNRCIAQQVMDKYFYYPPRTPPPMDEDCLHLSLVSPQPSSEKRAVMVYIHGGGLAAGSSADIEPEALAIVADVIHVTINYRLNVFGFLASTDDSAPGNAGFYDQILALRWVKENIANFGGDPDRITIFGISAGGWSVSALMVSPLAKGLFIRAISQSGSMYGWDMETREERQAKTAAFATSFGCDTEADMITCLREAPAEELFANATANMYPPLMCPIYGDDFFPEPITALYDSHKIHENIDYVMGTTSDEGGLALGMVPKEEEEDFIPLVTDGIDINDPLVPTGMGLMVMMLLQIPPTSSRYAEVSKVLQNIYFKTPEIKLSNTRGLVDLVSDGMFMAPTIGTAEKVAEAGNKVYMYWMDQTPVKRMPTNFPHLHLVAAPELGMGALHGFDAFYMFGHLNVDDAPMGYSKGASVPDKKVGKSMTNAWATFAKTGVPVFLDDDDQEVAWPEFTNSKENYLNIHYPMSKDSVKQRMRPGASELWNKLIPAYIRSLPDNPVVLEQPEGASEQTEGKDEL